MHALVEMHRPDTLHFHCRASQIGVSVMVNIFSNDPLMRGGNEEARTMEENAKLYQELAISRR